MEVEELGPVAPSSLTPVERASEEDDGFVDILESDLKVNSLGPQNPYSLPAWIVQTISKATTSPQCQKNLRELILTNQKTRWAGATEE